jgi:radical SAM-linked protein
MTRVRYRVRFAKVGLLRWISHHDLLRLWERMLRRASLPLSMTEGFHPKPRINFPSALALGVCGENEVVEIDLAEDLPASEVEQRLLDDRQPGFEVLGVRRMPTGAPKAQPARLVYGLEFSRDRSVSVSETARQFLAQGRLSVARDGKSLEFDLSREVAELRVEDGRVTMILNASRQAALRPTEVACALGLEDVLLQGNPLTRIRVELEDELQGINA